jgi:four helix bundle protein
MLQTYQDLRVWQVGADLAECIYKITSSFPEIERYGLVSQMRRASISIVSNIAEGYRRSIRERRKFVSYAYGSASELETQLLLAIRLGFCLPDDSLTQIAKEGIKHELCLINLYYRSLS